MAEIDEIFVVLLVQGISFDDDAFFFDFSECMYGLLLGFVCRTVI